MTRYLFPAILAVAAFPVWADEPKKEKDEPKKVKFDLLKTKHIVVEVKLNGKGPYRLIFDTGAPLMLINNRIAKDAGVTEKNAKGPPLALFGAMGQFNIKEFQMGELKATDVSTMVMDHPTVQAISELFGPIDGLVGFPFFARYRMTVDYQAKEFTFAPVDYKPSNLFDTLMATMMSGQKDAGKPKILVPQAHWGFVADKATKDEDAGVDVKEVSKDGAADKAGLKAGDRLLTIDGRWTDTIVDLFEAASHVKPDQTVPMKIKRDGKEVELKLTPTKLSVF
jgi:membrane-associated protease RseP (regulator of RpoE activity)